MGFFSTTSKAALICLVFAIALPHFFHQAKVIGLLRTPSSTPVARKNFVVISDTTYCEDVHYYSQGHVLFTACEDNNSTRYEWFPPLGIFDRPETIGQGSIHVINPKSMISTRLEFENFHGRFVTHGIDVIADPSAEDAVFIFAVNHLPNDDYRPGESTPKARSQIEIFHHHLGSQSVRHVRSVVHELITTPNDIHAISPAAFYITNDHFYREGILRGIEDAIPAAGWSNTAYVQLSTLDTNDSDEGVSASMAFTGLHNNNGLGRGPRISSAEREVLVTSACSGVFHRLAAPAGEQHKLNLIESIHMPSNLDNPSYLFDPYATTGKDISGYILPGLSKGFDFQRTYSDRGIVHPGAIWYIPKSTEGNWEIRLLFEDDGSKISATTSAVAVPNEPEGETRSVWLFVAGFMADNIIAVKVEMGTTMASAALKPFLTPTIWIFVVISTTDRLVTTVFNFVLYPKMGSMGDKGYPVTLLDLPNDILREILDYFQFVDESGKKISWKAHHQVLTKENKSRKQAVQRVRLVCRSLCELASPLLCPVLRVSLDERSLDAVKHLSQNPFIATGVRGIVVSLDYRPQELAVDFTRYIKHQRDNLESIERNCYSFARIEFPRNHDAEIGNEQHAIWPLWFKSYLKSIYRIHSACLAWNTDRSVSENITQARDEERREYQQIILRGYEDYRKRQEEQFRLVTDGRFVKSLASSMIHMPNVARVAFSHMESSSKIHHCDPVFFQNKGKFSEAMAAPLNWQEIEKLEGSVIIPSRILSELPIAIYRSGVRLRSLCIGCFPTKKGFSLIAPGQLWNAKWADLHKACQYLKEFQIGGTGMNHRPIRYDYLTTEEKGPIDNYLKAVFSSAYLEDLDISFYALGLDDGRTTKEGFYNLGPILPTADWQRMRRIKITNIESNQDDLEKLCHGLGNSLEELIWYSIKLQKGVWFSVFDILRGHLEQRYSQRKFRISVRYLSGGEFGVNEAKKQSLWEFRQSDWEDKEEIYTQVENYICSNGVHENPMMGWRQGQNSS